MNHTVAEVAAGHAALFKTASMNTSFTAVDIGEIAVIEYTVQQIDMREMTFRKNYIVEITAIKMDAVNFRTFDKISLKQTAGDIFFLIHGFLKITCFQQFLWSRGFSSPFSLIVSFLLRLLNVTQNVYNHYNRK